jgi:hypothetical protein
LRFGFGLLWTALVALPLMMAIQEICDHTALATGKTLRELARAHFGQWARACTGVLIVALVVASTLNIAGNLVGRGGLPSARVRATVRERSEPGSVQTTRSLAASSPALKAAITMTDLAISHPPGLPESGAPGNYPSAAAGQARQRLAVTALQRTAARRRPGGDDAALGTKAAAAEGPVPPSRPVLAEPPAGTVGRPVMEQEAATARAGGPRGARTVVRVGGRFRLDDRAGELSATSLWKGTDELLRRPVAVYLVPPSRPVAVGVVAAVRAAARVSDPRLARVYDADFSAGRPYVVTEWAPGEHVDDLLLAGPLSPALAAAIIADAADALAVAHDAGLAHLCLVPRSLRWGAGGVKVTGLGIEAGLAGAVAGDPAGADTQALARIMYALLTGYWPGAEATRLPPAPRHRGRLCAPRQVRAGIPGILSAITVRALQPEPGDAGLATPAHLARELRRGSGRDLPRRGTRLSGSGRDRWRARSYGGFATS